MRAADPYLSYRFKIYIDNIDQGGFSEISGLESTTQVEDFREGGLNDYVHKLPKETTFVNLVLKRGMGDSNHLWEWYREVVSGKIIRKLIMIAMLKNNPVGTKEIVKEWTFKEAFPVKWSGPELKADTNSVAFESLEWVHHGYDL